MRTFFTILFLMYIEAVFTSTISRQQSDEKNKYQDNAAEATGFNGPEVVQANSKYFQYAHVPQKDHYEIGHRKGNEHHFIEKHEKAHPHAGEFKTKVRWGDKHGGYGEHYWDFNHAGHDDSYDEGTEITSEYRDAEEGQIRKKRDPILKKTILFYDQNSGVIFDSITNRRYLIKPIN